MGWDIVHGNYQMYLTQSDPLGTSQGYWRVGPKSQPYGRFARGFNSSRGMNAMYFDLDDKFYDAQRKGGPRTWRVSPRYANPDWYPITQVSTPPEQRLDRLPESGWTRLETYHEGLPVIDLGTNREAAVGDVVYAATTIEANRARTACLQFASSSQTQLWLNGRPLGYVPNEKGVDCLRGRSMKTADPRGFTQIGWMANTYPRRFASICGSYSFPTLP